LSTHPITKRDLQSRFHTSFDEKTSGKDKINNYVIIT